MDTEGNLKSTPPGRGGISFGRPGTRQGFEYIRADYQGDVLALPEGQYGDDPLSLVKPGIGEKTRKDEDGSKYIYFKARDWIIAQAPNEEEIFSSLYR